MNWIRVAKQIQLIKGCKLKNYQKNWLINVLHTWVSVIKYLKKFDNLIKLLG